ncbi:MAG TPA: hypothetical protein VFQ38_16615 [Longimicrobiales bacterium]|nr:hypothetical protein [Longimicrobiales bacterium]
MTLVLLIPLLLQAPPQDSAALVKAAKRAQAQYEYLARSRAPIRMAPSGRQPCDEVVGRFCLFFDSNERDTPLPPEPLPATRARKEAVVALTRAAERSPMEARVARSLVRDLVEDGRPAEALQAARRFAWATADTLWGRLLLGFALHAVEEDTAAEREFAAAVPRLPERERKRLRIDALLSPDERARVRRLEGTARASYEAALWRLSDPLYLTPGNERWVEHVARYVWSRMLEEAPVVTGMLSWGDDLEELTLRYGVPRGRERTPSFGMGFEPDRLVERYDPASLAFVPESLLLAGVRGPPDPGAPWEAEALRSRTGYAPSAARKVVHLAHQLSRFPAGDSVVVRVDASLPLDSLAEGAATAPAGMFVLPGPAALLRGDTAEVSEVRARASAVDSGHALAVTMQATLPPGSYVYSAEALEPRSRLAGVARHSVVLLARAGRPALSDILVAFPFPAGAAPKGRDDAALRGRGNLAIDVGETVGLYAEVSGLAAAPGDIRRYRVQLELVPLEAPPAPARAVSWLARALGLAKGGTRQVRLAWSGEAPATLQPVVLTTNLELPRVSPGLYGLTVTVTDAVGGGSARSERHIRIAARH